MFPDIGHECVIIFFVLSGYVISFATLSKPEELKHYIIARLARLYSVLVPAILLTEALRYFGGRMNAALYAQYDRGHELMRAVLSFFFLQESWFLSASPPTNGPMWSLGYEFWYYVLFGILVFVRPMRLKAMTALIALAIMGFKLLLLFPIWILGAGCFAAGQRVRLRPSLARWGFLGSLMLGAWLMTSGWRFPATFDLKRLAYSSFFVSDFALGIAVSMTIFFFAQGFCNLDVPKRVEKGVRSVADMTFSLYLYHFPILLFCAAAFNVRERSSVQTFTVIAGIVVVVILLSRVTEARKNLVRRWIGELWTLLRNPMPLSRP